MEYRCENGHLMKAVRSNDDSTLWLKSKNLNNEERRAIIKCINQLLINNLKIKHLFKIAIHCVCSQHTEVTSN